jgi:acetolactate synthase regulatory subunit
MTRRRAAVTDAELNRVLRVARKHGAQAVEVTTPGASFRVVLVDSVEKPKAKVAKKSEALI